jgi:hypothetical protein
MSDTCGVSAGRSATRRTQANAQVSGLSAVVSVAGAVAGADRLTVNALAGADVIDASLVPPTRRC